MDHAKESSDFSFELLVSIKEGLESLEQGLRKKAISAIQKRLRAKDAHNRSFGTPSDLERQFRKLMTREKEKESAMKNIVEVGKVLVVVERVISSCSGHTSDVLCFTAGDEVTDVQVANGYLLSDGESVKVNASVDINNLDYRQAEVIVMNHNGQPNRKVHVGTKLVVWKEEDLCFEEVLYDPNIQGAPRYRDFCPREWGQEMEQYAHAVVLYLQTTSDIAFGWKALKGLSWISTNNQYDDIMAVVAAQLHVMGEDVLGPLRNAKETQKLDTVTNRLLEIGFYGETGKKYYDWS